MHEVPYSELKWAYLNHPETKKSITPLECLKFQKTINLSHRNYASLRRFVKEKTGCRLASQKEVLAEKKKTYPKNISATDTEVKVPLQNVADITASRLLEKKCLDREKPLKDLVLIGKVGGDGQGNHTIYNQADNQRGTNFYTMAYSPLMLKSGDEIIWSAKEPNSRDNCRVISQTWAKETEPFMKEKTSDLQEQIDNLVQTDISDGIKVKHVILPVMYDGKSINCMAKVHMKKHKIADTLSYQACHLCNKNMSQFTNSFDSDIIPEMKDMLKNGPAILHTQIRVFEDLVKASAWALTKKFTHSKMTFKTAMKLLQKRFLSRQRGLNVRIFFPQPNSGNSNNGNTVRRCFKDPEKFANCLGVSVRLISDTGKLISKLTDQTTIHDPKLFHKEAYAVWKRYRKELGPYKKMCTTYHRLLCHGAAYLQFAKDLGIPSGCLSESAIEHLNSLNRYNRQYLSRKTSARDQNLDMFRRNIWTTDPVLNSV